MSETTSPTRISDIGTVGIPVADQDRALAFYQERLGFETRMDLPYGEGERWIELAPAAAATSIALVRAADGQATGVDTGIRFSTDDAAADHAALRAAGVDVDEEVIPYPVPMFIVRDPDGNRLVIVERPSDG
jgi:catechol 2,3-dioxygenase-like lactoylglutathione lyase family enzyme